DAGQVSCLLYQVETPVVQRDGQELGFLYRFRRSYVDTIPRDRQVRIFPSIPGAFDSKFDRWIGLLVAGRTPSTTESVRTVPLFVETGRTDRVRAFHFDLTQEPISADAFTFYEQLRQLDGDGRSIYEPAPNAIPGNVREETDAGNVNVFGYVHATRSSSLRMYYRGTPPAISSRCN
ncbi:MAG: hypothetical protein AAFZ52_16830, partial [Bacteroidota bacterium]